MRFAIERGDLGSGAGSGALAADFRNNMGFGEEQCRYREQEEEWLHAAFLMFGSVSDNLIRLLTNRNQNAKTDGPEWHVQWMRLSP
ncbi:MAG: hypothetical protein AAF585_03940 [Verrucomicrobiota bacterium]